jgi:hypothetical protein
LKTSLLPLLLAWPPLAFAQDRVSGLLSLPEVFGNGPCASFTPREIPLYAAPDGQKIVAAIRVDRHWTFPGNGGCGGLIVRVHHSDGRVSELPTEEYQYEAPAAIVLQQRGRWFRLRLTGGTAWVHASERDEFFALEDLVKGTLTTLPRKRIVGPGVRRCAGCREPARRG